MQPDVCAIVVTFNRKALLQECIDALLLQTHPLRSIYIIDNASTDGTFEHLSQHDVLDDDMIKYIRLPKNLGGAGGFAHGLQAAFERQHDFYYLLDDDAEPETKAIQKLLKAYDDQYSALASTVYTGSREDNYLETIGQRGDLDLAHPLPTLHKPLSDDAFTKQRVEINMASFVGILIPHDSVVEVGFPRSEFFIHFDDVEYCTRLARLGKILMVHDSIIYHKEKRQEEKVLRSFLWSKKQRIRYEMLWLKYYGRRNSVYLGRELGTNKTAFYLSFFKEYFRLLIDILLYDDHKIRRLHFSTASYFDGLLGRFDNEKAKKILYD